MDHNSNPKPQILKGSQSKRQPAARAAQFNHALQRTAAGVTAHAPTAFAPAAFPHGLRRPPQSLSLGSLGDSPHLD